MSTQNSENTLDLIIRNGLVVTSDEPVAGDIGVKDGKIVAIVEHIQQPARTTVDASGHLVFPGFIDAHTHMGIPIKTTWSADDFASGTQAAIFGGVTTILDFSVQQPGQSIREALEERFNRARGQALTDFGIHVNITDQPEKWLHQISSLIADGFNSFKVFSTYREAGMMVDWAQFRAILQAVHTHGGLLMLHAEDNAIVERETQHWLDQAKTAPIYHARSRPAEAEAEAIRQAAKIAGELEARLYVVHVSSKAGLEAGLQARRNGVHIHLETCPQYLLLSEETFGEEDGHYYIATPPLRTKADNEALWQALAEGDIDTVGTDHCPFTCAQKNANDNRFDRTPNGLPGVETLFPLLYTYGVRKKRLSLSRLIDLLARNPARIYGIDRRKGDIRVGLDADFVIWNPDEETVITAQHQHGNADWSPYEGWPISGALAYTIRRGEVLVDHAQFVGTPGSGEFVPGVAR